MLGWAGGGRTRRAVNSIIAVRRELMDSHARRFLADERGVTAVVFAIVFAAVFLGAAIATDYGRTQTAQVRSQNALDTSLLAASQRLGTQDQDTSGPEKAKAYFKANAGKLPTSAALGKVEMDGDKGEVRSIATGNVVSSLLRAAGIDTIAFGSRSAVRKGGTSVEVALVLDNSSALAGKPIEDLRVAARSFVNVVMTGAKPDHIKIGVVPFAGAVNVGADKRGAWWIDAAGGASYHSENFSEPVSRFTLFDRLGTSWAGCVEARPTPHDVDDTPPDASTPNTLFVPIFAPDEPDPVNAGSDTFVNDYLADSGGTCTPQTPVCQNYSRRGNCTSWSTPPIPSLQAQTQVCKYTGATPTVTALVPTKTGPNMNCDSTALTQLTSVRSEINAALDRMTAAGGSNISEGVAWGWRVLAPALPFAQGRAYAPENKKYMILMARGANWVEGIKNMNHSYYSAWGYGATNRLNPNSHTTQSLTNSMNEKSRDVCRGVSDKGIKVYTIGFGASDAHTRSMLQYCATHPSMSFSADTLDELKAVFESIARDITPARISG